MGLAFGRRKQYEGAQEGWAVQSGEVPVWASRRGWRVGLDRFDDDDEVRMWLLGWRSGFGTL